MRALTVILSLALSGCSVALSGHESTGGGGTASSTTAAATHGHASIGSAKVSASFGTPVPAGSGGGQVSFSRGASAFLLMGLVVAEVVNYFSSPSADATPFRADRGRSIAHTCSCYGYQPASQLTSAGATE
jgi:hypothetical protein